MDTIFTLGDEDDPNTKLNLDELYERKKISDLNTLKIYNKILNRIHSKIKHLSRIHRTEQHCWYVIPEVIIGVPKYDHSSCTAYIIDKLKSNGFLIRYTHPNLLFISWKNWTPQYVREEIRKKTGLNIDGWGNKKLEKEEIITENNNDKLLLNLNNDDLNIKKINTSFKDINSYKPSGNLIYNNDIIKKMENKLHN
ncbi:hypothetical protein N9O88_01105 [bacterium]|nr:hypothetical protein [bacterium]